MDKQSSIKSYGTLRRYNWFMSQCRNFMRNPCYAAYMSCEVAMLPFQAHAYYGTWSIDFGTNSIMYGHL